MLRSLTKAVAFGGALGIAGAAGAVPIAGTSSGTFSNLSNCDNSGADRDCRIVSTSNGNNTQVQWGSQSSSSNFVNPSTLTAVDVGISTMTNADDVVIGRLDWTNRATLAGETPDRFGVNWNLAVVFSQPVASSDPLGFETFNLTVVNTGNPAGDLIGGMTLADLAGIVVDLAGVTVTDFKYSVLGADTSLSNRIVWYNGENKSASLLITADFRNKVPEPGTLLLLGALGLAGLAAGRRRAA